MPAHAPNPLNEARVGLVTLCIILGVSALLIVLSSIRWQPRETYQLAFRVNQDATGIEVGTPVRMGGIQWGEVTRVSRGEIPAEGSLAPMAQPGALAKSRGTLVEFAIDSRLELWPDAKVMRASTILGGDVHLVILDTGLARGGMATLAMKTRESLGQREVLPAWDGSTAVPNLFGVRLASRLDRLPDDWEAVRKFYVDTVAQDVPARKDAIVAGFVKLRDEVKADVSAWDPDAERLSASFRTIRDRLADPAGAVAAVESGWKGMRPDLDAVQRDLADLRTRVNDQVEPRLVSLAGRAEAEWARAGRAWSQVSESGIEAFAAYGSVAADGSLMAGQLGKAEGELLQLLLRLLLGKPGEDGMARMQRFEAASRLVVATSDLRRANEALLALADGTETVDPAMARQLRDAAARCVARFRVAVDRLNQLWQQPSR